MIEFWEKNPEMASFRQWTSDPLISRHVYNLISNGESNGHWLTWLFESYFKNYDNIKVLSIGCGVGDHEIPMARFSNVSHIDAFDGSNASINLAIQKKVDPDHSKINFYVDDFNKSIFPENEYDLVICSGSLHHVREIENLLIQITRCLKKDGFFIANEYIGDCYNIYEKSHVDLVNDVLGNLPLDYRHNNSKLVNPTLSDVFNRDPSEAVRSKLIQGFLRIFFKSVDERSFGGYLLHPLYPHLKLDSDTGSVSNSGLIASLISYDNYLRLSGMSDFSFFICKKT